MSFSSDNVQVFLAVLDHGSFSAAARARCGACPRPSA
jgi:DNA-binding transcriptional LysR family regulator